MSNDISPESQNPTPPGWHPVGQNAEFWDTNKKKGALPLRKRFNYCAYNAQGGQGYGVYTSVTDYAKWIETRLAARSAYLSAADVTQFVL